LFGKKAFEFMDRDEAATIDVTSKGNGLLTLWLRMENYDTIEMRLLRTSSANDRTAPPNSDHPEFPSIDTLIGHERG